jgi:hypothetical protein
MGPDPLRHGPSNNFVRTDASGFPVGNAIATPRSLLLGFGLEGVSTAAQRSATT